MDIIRKKKSENQNPYSSYGSYVELNRQDLIPRRPRIDSKNEKKYQKPKRINFKRFLKISVFVFSGLIIALGSYFVFKIGAVGKEIRAEKSTVIENVGSLISSFIPQDRKILRGEPEGRINILLLGAAGKGKPGQNLTDTIMVMSLDAKNKKVALFSLPRDLYANIFGTSYYTKINSVYQYGITNNQGADPIKKTVEKITGLTLHYFLILDFEGFKKIIDDMGGINVTVERDIYDPRYPGPNYSYETFEIKKGTHLLNGETALKYVRERHDDPEGDFGRAKRQQQVMQSVKNKTFSLKTYLNPITLNRLLNDLSDNVKTDIDLNEIESFIGLIRECDTQNINNVVIDAWKKDSVLKVSHVFAGGVQAFILVPRTGNFSEIQDLAENVFDLNAIKRRMSEIEKENASLSILNMSGNEVSNHKVREILENKVGIKNIKISYSPSSRKLDRTLVFDRTGGQKIFTLDEVIKKLGAGLDTDNSDIIDGQDADLVLAIGTDLRNLELFEEDNPENLKNASDSQEYFELIKK